MIEIKTYQDLIEVGQDETERMNFVLEAISEHKGSGLYSKALDGKDYITGHNSTIKRYQKLLYTVSGKTVPDNYTANHKCASGFFKRFCTQLDSYLLGNGINFSDKKTLEKLGKGFEKKVFNGVKSALAQSVSFGFWNNDHLEMFELVNFVPLYDEENGALMAGIRFWQIDSDKPLRATLFEVDGYTDYIKLEDENIKVKQEKRPYRQIKVSSEADGEKIYNGENYPTFPIIPLWTNAEKQSELEGKREQIDCYDLIKSGFANDLDDASMIYWTIQNAGGMDDIDLAKFIERMRTVKAAVVDDDGAKAEAHTLDVPYQAREAALTRLEKDLAKDFMMLDIENIASGAITATQIEAAYEPLNERADELETYLTDFIMKILELAGIDDKPTYTRSKITNRQEEVDMILSAAQYFDNEYITEKLLTIFGDIDRADEVIKNKRAEEVNRYSTDEEEEEEGEE